MKHPVQEYSDRANIKEGDLTPINLCLKYKPPSLALYYKLATNPGKKFVHMVNIEGEVREGMSASGIYERLAVSEPMYWDPKSVSKEQIVRVIEKLIERQSVLTASRLKKNQFLKKGEQLAITTTDCATPPAAKSAENIDSSTLSTRSIKAQAVPLIPAHESNTITEAPTSNSQEDAEEFDEMTRNKIYEVMFKGGSEVSAGGDSKRCSITEDEQLKYFSGFQCVYVEELKQEVFMDSVGNLYDMQGNAIGQADLSEEANL
eukprot:TRINITY_DN2352_c0_g1_i4.p1 TRINITY_DN2352_c0_g1~~TRINITY_DN2352_c0_g1_i4.p1  ORF type:complete len:261 (+),score=72.49 TRINITY_DN2352_c0_g1_i4:112-894(+)